MSILRNLFCRRSSQDSVDLDALFAELESFGPHQRIPAATRLRKKLPSLTDAQRKEIEATLSSVSQTIWELAERGGEAKIAKTEMIGYLQDKHPFLKEKGLVLALFLANYYAWHEGYDK